MSKTIQETINKAREEGYAEGWNDCAWSKPHKYLKQKQDDTK